MNVAGRKMVGSTSTPVRPGLAASSSAASTPRVTSSVLPSGCFSTISSRPGPSLMTASPIGGGEPIGHVGHVAEPERRAAAEGDDGAGQVVRRRRPATGGGRPAAGSACRRSRRPRAPAASPAALMHRVERDAVGRAAGRDRPAPGTAGRAGPRWRRWPRRGPTSASGGSSTGPASVRSVLRRASSTRRRSSARGWSTRAAGRMTGGRATAGSRARLGGDPLLHELAGADEVGAVARRSARPTTGRAPTSSGPSSTPGMPLSAFSSGMVTRLSTSSVDRPGASVWISTSGGANSGNTSSGAPLRRADADHDQHHGEREDEHAQPQARW